MRAEEPVAERFDMEETMKICPYCKNENPDTNKFCNYCGAQLSGVEPEGGPVEEPDFSRFFATEQAPAASTAVPGRSGLYEDFTRGQGKQNAERPGGQNAYQPGGQNGYQPGGQNGYQPGGQNGYQPVGQNGYQPVGQNGYQPGGQNGYQPGARNIPRQGRQRGVRRNNPQQYTYSPTPFDSIVPEIAIGKYIVWSIFDSFFSLLFGILGLVFVLKINKSDTVEEQQKNLKYARIFLIIGTVIAVLNIALIILPRYF